MDFDPSVVYAAPAVVGVRALLLVAEPDLMLDASRDEESRDPEDLAAEFSGGWAEEPVPGQVGSAWLFLADLAGPGRNQAKRPESLQGLRALSSSDYLTQRNLKNLVKKIQTTSGPN